MTRYLLVTKKVTDRALCFQHLRLFSNTSKEEFANLPLYHYNKDNKKLFITPNKKFVDYFYGGKQWRKSNGF